MSESDDNNNVVLKGVLDKLDKIEEEIWINYLVLKTRWSLLKKKNIKVLSLSMLKTFKEYLGGIRLGYHDNVKPKLTGDKAPKGMAGRDSRGVDLHALITLHRHLEFYKTYVDC